MPPVEPAEASLPSRAPAPAVAEQPDAVAPASPVHLVVVTSRGLEAGETGSTGVTLCTRFWHPRDRCWSENDFESLEHALRLFVDESGWVLRQAQALDGPLAMEWIFEAHRIDFTRPTQEEILQEIGMTPDSVNRLMEQVDRGQPDR
jgi:hypothetical protein